MEAMTNRDIVATLIEHEEKIAQFYAVLQDALPDMAEFWGELVEHEQEHAEILRALETMLDENDITLQKRTFNMFAVRMAIDHVEKQIGKVLSSGTTPIRALASAADLERSGLERDFFKVFEADTPEMKRDFQLLHADTMEHRDGLEVRLKEERGMA